MKIGSFSFIATDNIWREAAFLCFSIRQISSQPIFCFCDYETKARLESYEFGNIEFKLGATPADIARAEQETATVQTQNGFHKKGAICLKMDALEWAVKEAGNTMFVDADIVFLQPPQVVESEAMLSPHYHFDNIKQQNSKIGIFNAGYIWTNQTDFGKEWKNIYLNHSSFYEQQGMWKLFESFNCQLFDKSHNVGFWRFARNWYKGNLESVRLHGMEYSEIVSGHFHIDANAWRNADQGLGQGYAALKDWFFWKLPKAYKDFANALF